MDETALQRIYLNKQKIAELEAENKELYAELGLPQTPVGVYKQGRYQVDITPNVRFDAAIATTLFPLGEDGTNMELYKATIDSAKAKKALSPEDYARCQKVFDNNKVEVKLV